MYVLIPTENGRGVLHSLSSQPGSDARLAEGLEHLAQFFTALLKCDSSVVYASESNGLILEVKLADTLWTH